MSDLPSLNECPIGHPTEDGLILVTLHTTPKKYYVFCWDCQLKGPAKKTEAKAIEAWNRRG